MYVETEGLGHSFISVGECKNTIVYKYGRYLSGDKDKSSSSSTDPTGRGVMVRLSGKKALNYIGKEGKKHNLSGYKILDANENAADNVFDSSRKLTTVESSIFEGKAQEVSSDARVVDKYNLLNNNCTTKSIDFVKSGGTKLDLNYITQGHHGEYIMTLIFAPLYLHIKNSK